MSTVLRRLIVIGAPVVLALAPAPAQSAPPMPTPGASTGPQQLCTTTSVPATVTGTLTLASGPEPHIDLSSPPTGFAGDNCTRRFVADVVNNVVMTPPAPLASWITKFEVRGVYPSLPQNAAACAALTLDSELWGEHNGRWTEIVNVHHQGEWKVGSAAGHYCEPPTGDHAVTMPPRDSGYARYRVAATTGAPLRIRAEIIGPKATLSEMQFVVAHGGAPRPSTNIFYAGEPMSISVGGNIQNATGGDVCFYTVTTEHLNTKHKTESHFNRFKVHPLPALAEIGHYRLVAEATSKDPLPHCQGKVERTLNLHSAHAPWIMDVALQGFGYHFNAHDAAGMPQFCENCTSLFSPAHNIGLLRITPQVQFGSLACTYEVVQKFDNDVRSKEVWYPAGGPLIPPLPKGGSAGDDPKANPPFLNRWGNSNNVVTVTVRGKQIDLGGTPACNVNHADGHITKTITFTDNEKQPAVSK